MASEQVQVSSAPAEKTQETTPLLEETGDAAAKQTPAKPKAVKDIRPKMSGIPATPFEEGFYRNFMNPMMQKLEENMKANNEILDEINRNMAKERDDRRKKQLSKHIPDELQGQGQDLKSVMQHIEQLIVYDNYQKGEDESKLVKAKLKTLDTDSEVAILSHGISAYVSTLEPYHLKHFSQKIISDTSLWLSRLFRFPEASAYFHEEEREGLVRVCRLALHQRYPKFGTDGYEALYSRPPVIYVSGAARASLGQYLCAQLGLPQSSLRSVPVKTSYGLVHKMDLDALDKLIEDDKASGKTPVLIVAYAGTPVVGHVDNVQRLNEMCKKEEIWLHVEGNNLATLLLYSVPTNVLPAKAGDSMTLNLGSWLGLPAVPYTTLFKCSSADQAASSGLLSSNSQYRLHCLPIWVCLQSLGHDGIVQKVQYTLKLAQMVRDKIDSVPSLKNINKKVQPPPDPTDPKKETFSLGGLISKAISALVIFEMENPTVVFKYQQLKDESPKKPGDEQPSADEAGESRPHQLDPYYNALNIWLAETLKREVQQVHVTAVEIENEGVCIRFAPMESAHMFDTTEDFVKKFVECLDVQVTILDATVKQRQDFQDIVEAQDNLKLVVLKQWAGLGAVQYIPERWIEQVIDLPDEAKQEVNALNHHLLHQLKSSDNAFSLGQTEEGSYCVRFGLITKYTDLEELIGLVYTTGKEVEESSKFLDHMADVIKQSIEKASHDLEEENQQKLAQEGVLRQIPLVGSMINWWSPPPKDVGIKGRSLNLASGEVESTESIYKYHMQVQETPAELSPRTREGPLKNNLKPVRRRSGGRTTSETSTGSAPDAVPLSPAPPESSLPGVPEQEQQEVKQGSEVNQGSGVLASELAPAETAVEVAKEATEGSKPEAPQEDLK